MKKIEHIGIAVRDLASSNLLYEKLLGAQVYKEEYVEARISDDSFIQMGESKSDCYKPALRILPLQNLLKKKEKAFIISPLKYTIFSLKWKDYVYRGFRF
ncbi:MAG: hypothetical protein U0T81_04525 [Saprospiraceae bacterium]